MASRSDLYSIVFEVIEAVHADHRKSPNWPTNPTQAMAFFASEVGTLRVEENLCFGTTPSNHVDKVRSSAIRLTAIALRFLVGIDSYRRDASTNERIQQDLTPPWKGAPEWGGAQSVTLYATDDEIFKYDTLTEALHSILDETRELIAGETTVYECTFEPYDPAEAFDLDTIIGQANEKADVDAGYDDADSLFNWRISVADALHLQGLLNAWARKHASERRLKPIGKSRAIVLTEDDIKAFEEDQNGKAVTP